MRPPRARFAARSSPSGSATRGARCDWRPGTSTDYARGWTFSGSGSRSVVPTWWACRELKLEDDQFPRDELAAEGYEAVVFGQRSWNGVAILFRREDRSGHGDRARSAGPGGAGRAAPGRHGRRNLFHHAVRAERQDVGHEDFPSSPGSTRWPRTSTSSPKCDPPGRLVRATSTSARARSTLGTKRSSAGALFHTEDERRRFGGPARVRLPRRLPRALPRPGHRSRGGTTAPVRST